MKGVDPYQHWEVNGVNLNNIIWLSSHITWAENFLILKGTGGTALDISWLDHYNISSDGSLHDKQHDMKTILDALKEVHTRAMEHLLTVTDEQMEAPNKFGFNFGGIETNRILVQHAIRHESMHTGHLSWLCKINKLESI